MPPPQLPTRPQETQRQISLQPLRVPQLQPAATTDVAAIFASVLKGTVELTSSIVEADKKVADSFHVDLDINLAKAATAVETERLLAAEEGRPARSDRDILREQFGDNRDNLNSMIRSIGRSLASEKANQIEADWISGKNKDFGPLFREARIEAESLFADDEVRKEGYLDRLVETETSINERLIQQQMNDARVTLAADQLNVVNVTVVADTNSYFSDDGALIQRGDEAEPFYIHKNALGAYAKLTWNKTWDELSNGQQAQAVAFTIPQMFQAIAEIPNIQPEKKDELLDRYARAVKEDPDLSLEFKKILRKERKNYDALSVASTNKGYTNRISELSTGLKLAKTIPQVLRMEAMLSASFDPENTEAFGRIPMGLTDAGQLIYSGKISPTVMSNLGVEYRALLEKNKRSLQIEATLIDGNSPGLKNSDDAYLDSEYLRRLETLTRPEAMVDMMRHFKSTSALTPTMVSEINAVWKENPEEAMSILDDIRAERPDIINSADLRDALDSDIRDAFNVISLGQLTSSDVLSQIARSSFTGADYAIIKTEVETEAGKLKPPDDRFFGADPIRSRQAADLHQSAYKFFRRLGQTDDEAETNADTLYIKSTESLTFNKQEVVVITSPVNVAEGGPPGGFVVNQFGNFVYDELGIIFDLASQLDKWDSTTSIDVQDVALSEDRRNWQFKVIENTDGLADRTIKIFNVPVDDVARIKLLRVLEDAIRQRDISGGGTGVPIEPFSLGNILKRLFGPSQPRPGVGGFLPRHGGVDLLFDVGRKEIRKSGAVQSPAFFDREDEGLSRFR